MKRVMDDSEPYNDACWNDHVVVEFEKFLSWHAVEVSHHSERHSVSAQSFSQENGR